jgi:hypothetical protein
MGWILHATIAFFSPPTPRLLSTPNNSYSVLHIQQEVDHQWNVSLFICSINTFAQIPFFLDLPISTSPDLTDMCQKLILNSIKLHGRLQN